MSWVRVPSPAFDSHSTRQELKFLSDSLSRLKPTGVKVFASKFFNFAIAQLLKDIPASSLNLLVKFTALGSNGWNVLERVIVNAKRYYCDWQFRNAVDTVITEQAATLRVQAGKELYHQK